MFEPSVGAQLDQAFTDILRDLRTQYLVGYYPREIPADACVSGARNDRRDGDGAACFFHAGGDVEVRGHAPRERESALVGGRVRDASQQRVKPVGGTTRRGAG